MDLPEPQRVHPSHAWADMLILAASQRLIGAAQGQKRAVFLVRTTATAASWKVHAHLDERGLAKLEAVLPHLAHGDATL